jgi:catechol 2,3-dioxygenase-like lactoylglutathione lyase family enzyme
MTREHEPGVVHYEFAKSVDEADTYVVVEVYKDLESHAAHMSSAWVRSSLPLSTRLIEGRPHIGQYVSRGSEPVRQRLFPARPGDTVSNERIAMHATKLVVRDLDAAERFYRAAGLTVVSRNVGGEKEVRQSQCWLSCSGDRSTHMLILSCFLELPPPAAIEYPRECWLAFTVSDVDAMLVTVEAAGGGIIRAPQDRPEHNVRAAVVSDPEGHIIEVVGPMSGAAR